MSQSEHRPKTGELLRRANALEREAAIHKGDIYHAANNTRKRAKATTIREELLAPVEPEALAEVGAGGELLPYDGPFNDLGTPMEPQALPARVLRDTVKDPNYVTIDASRQRLELAADAGSLELGLDLAQTIDAENSLEKMLTQQLAAGHRSVMMLSARFNRNLESLQHATPEQLAKTYMQTVNVETSRIGNTLSRLQSAFQDGILALQKLRSKGQQTMVVQHVHVSDGGQAVVAGQVRSRKAGCRAPRTKTNDR